MISIILKTNAPVWIAMLIFAHRGDSGIEPENTLRAIHAALMSNSDGIEVDIHQVDDKLIVIHDRWLQRTTNGIGQIKSQSFANLRLLDAGEGEKIPTLDEVLTLVDDKCLINLELKGIESIELLFGYLDKAFKETNLDQKQLILSSFDHHLLKKINQQRPEFAIGALTASNTLTYAQFAEELNSSSIHIDINVVNLKFIQDAHTRGLKVYVYTVDELEDIFALKRLGVDGVFSNYPSKIKDYLTRLGGI